METILCTDPELIRILMIAKTLLTIAMVALPLIIIVKTTSEGVHIVLNDGQAELKKAASKLGVRILAAAMIFFVPTIVEVAIGFVGENLTAIDCLTEVSQQKYNNALSRRANEDLLKAEGTLQKTDYNVAYRSIKALEGTSEYQGYKNRLDILDKTIKENTTIPKKKNPIKSTVLKATGAVSSIGNAVAVGGVALKSEPDPAAAINYWSGNINPNNFIYSKDQSTNKSLGAWPKNYESIPSQLTNYKTYLNDTFIFPITPINGYNQNKYVSGYVHNGIDISAVFGSPVYSPVDGTLVYSEWGHTINVGDDETAYSVSIEMDKPVTVGGMKIERVFLTHMSGIRYRCSRGQCNQKIKKGELVGFSGNAAGDATTPGWAPHLHMTLYTAGGGMPQTPAIEKEVYNNIVSGTDMKAGG